MADFVTSGDMAGAADADGLTTLEANAEMISHAVVDYDPTKAAVVLAEDKQYYPSSEEVYGADVEVMVQDEDTQPIERAIIEPMKQKHFILTEQALPATTFDLRFLAGLMDHPRFIRNVAVAGTIHHGKTWLMDLLIDATHVRHAADVDDRNTGSLARKALGSDVTVDDAGAVADASAANAEARAQGTRLGTGYSKSRATEQSRAEKEAKAMENSRRYMDSRLDEQERMISIKSTPVSLVLPDLSGKSHLINLIDTPGHMCFAGEVTAGFRLSDGVLLCVDAVEGVTLNTERIITHAVAEKQAVVLCITKMDRLILDERLPPADAYYKLAHTIAEVNAILDKVGSTQKMQPASGNVLFTSAQHGWAFSVPSFAEAYAQHHRNFSADKFAKRLWGNIYLNEEDRTFSTKPSRPGHPRTFVQFLLEPLYKIYAHTVGSDAPQIEGLCSEIGVVLSKAELAMDAKPLLRLILSRFFSTSASAIVHALVAHLPSPVAAAPAKAHHTYSGPLAASSAIARGMLYCEAKAPLMVQIAKSYVRADCATFDSFGRVLSGTVRVGDKVRVLGPRYSPDDEEDMTVQEVTKIWVYQAGRYRVEVNRVVAGNWALFEGLDRGIAKTATVTSLEGGEDACVFRPLDFNTAANVKVALEPLVPSELPKMVDGLRKITKCYPLAETRVEESGEHVLMGAGELDLDCMLHDLRKLYSEIEVKTADPSVRFAETVSEASSIRCFAETPNKANLLTFIAEPLEKGISDDIEAGMFLPSSLTPFAFSTSTSTSTSTSSSSTSSSAGADKDAYVSPQVQAERDKQRVATYFQDKYGWDVLAARSIWAFGPDATGPNILCDDTLGVDKKLLYSVKDSIVEGFVWAVKEGPLCDEPIRDVKFRMTGCELSDDPQQRVRRQLIPTARRVAYSSFLLAAPRLLEPIQLIEVQAPPDCLVSVTEVLQTRRGHVIASHPRAGTPLHSVQAYVPLIDSFGFETDLRARTYGMAFCMSTFDHWAVVPGDPLDKSIVIRPLEVSPQQHLAREFMIKTRRRKGLSEDVVVNRYFDDAMLLELAKLSAAGEAM